MIIFLPDCERVTLGAFTFLDAFFGSFFFVLSFPFMPEFGAEKIRKQALIAERNEDFNL